jgi:hypothetical protein
MWWLQPHEEGESFHCLDLGSVETQNWIENHLHCTCHRWHWAVSPARRWLGDLECGMEGCWISYTLNNWVAVLLFPCTTRWWYCPWVFLCFLCLDFPASLSLPVVNLCSFKIKIKIYFVPWGNFQVSCPLCHTYVWSQTMPSLVLSSVHVSWVIITICQE